MYFHILYYMINVCHMIFIPSGYMENGPFIDGLPFLKLVIFHGYVSHNQMVILLSHFYAIILDGQRIDRGSRSPKNSFVRCGVRGAGAAVRLQGECTELGESKTLYRCPII